MRHIRLWPRNLSGQMVLLIAIALFVAQAINFAIQLQDRRASRYDQATGPVVTRIVDAVERAPSDNVVLLPEVLIINAPIVDTGTPGGD